MVLGMNFEEKCKYQKRKRLNFGDDSRSSFQSIEQGPLGNAAPDVRDASRWM